MQSVNDGMVLSEVILQIKNKLRYLEVTSDFQEKLFG
jgi:hypothetical protein